MYVLDTNVASELMRPSPVTTVAAWVAERNATDLFLTAISEAELRYGVALVPAGRRRNDLEAAMARWLNVGFGERILPFDSAAARHYADIASRRRRAGRPIQEADCQIAAISRSRGAVLVMRTSGISRPPASMSSIPGQSRGVDGAVTRLSQRPTRLPRRTPCR